MADDVMVKDSSINSCCEIWKEKYTKLKERFSKYETGRNALREAISILEQQISNLQAENLGLQKACNDERARAESEKEDREKEYAVRVTLENEVSSLKSEILLLQKNGGLADRGVDKEVASMQLLISEAERERIELKELLEKEKKKVVAEKEKAEMERKKAEKALEKLNVEKKKANVITDIAREKDQEVRLQIETLKREVDEAKSKLALETAKYEQENKKLKAEKEISKKERECAVKEMAKANDLQKLADSNLKKAMDERSCADNLSQQLDQNRKRVEKLEKELVKHASTRKLVKAAGSQAVEEGHGELSGEIGSGTISRETSALEACAKHEELEKKILRVRKQAKSEINKGHDELEKKIKRLKKQVKSEMKKAEEQMRNAVAYKSKAMVEKNRADHLSCQLDHYKERLEKVRHEIQELVSAVKVYKSFEPSPEGLQEATAEIKLLKKQLKFEQLRVKHAKQVSKMTIDQNQIFRQEIYCMKQEFLHFAKRFDILLDKSPGLHDVEKIGSLNLEQECFHMQPSLMVPHAETGFVKPSYTSSIATGRSSPVKHNKKCPELLPPVSGEVFTSPITGTDSSLELLLRGSNRKMLQPSAINSSSASFSDRPLVGSQEKGTVSVTTSALLTAEQYLERTTSSFADDMRKGFDEKLGVGPENSVGGPMKSGATERSRGHRKRKRLPHVVESIGKLYSAGQKWHHQVLQKLSVLHGMLDGECLKSSEEQRLRVPKIKENVCSELTRPHKKKKKATNVGQEMLPPNKLKMNLETLCTEISEICKDASTIECNTNATELKAVGEDLLGSRWHSARDYEYVLDQDYMNLVDLDYDNVEELLRKAIERPISPLSPSLANIQFPDTDVCEIEMHSPWSSQGSFRALKDLVQSYSFDVINVEIDSNQRVLEGFGTSNSLSLGKCKPHNDTQEDLNHSQSGNIDNVFSGQTQNSSILSGAPGVKSFTCECRVSGFTRFPEYCVKFPNDIGSSSIYRIFHVCCEIMFQSSGSCSIDRLIKNTLVSLQKADGLSAGERCSVFLSLLLHYIPKIAVDEFRTFCDRNFLQLIDSFAQQLSAVLNDEATRRMFLETCDVGQLLALIEDFLLNGTILVYDDACKRMMHQCVLRSVPSSKCIFWSSISASTDLLLVGGLLLASICASVDQISFICDISYNLLMMRKINLSFSLRLLHVFAHLCGPKYFTLEDYCLEMCVIKSLVVFFERLNCSPDNFSCLSSGDEDLVKVSACSACPFLDDVAPVDFVVSLLLEKLQSYSISWAEKQNPSGTLVSSNSVVSWHGTKTTDVPLPREADQLNFASNQRLCGFINILSLVELVSSFMAWEWTFDKVVIRVLSVVESYTYPAIIALVGELGRSGVDAKGYEDSKVDSLRKWFVGVIGGNTFRSCELSVQFASVNALTGLVATPLEEIIQTQNHSGSGATTDTQEVAVDCVSNWFSSLTKEEQSSFRSLLFL